MYFQPQRTQRVTKDTKDDARAGRACAQGVRTARRPVGRGGLRTPRFEEGALTRLGNAKTNRRCRRFRRCRSARQARDKQSTDLSVAPRGVTNQLIS